MHNCMGIHLEQVSIRNGGVASPAADPGNLLLTGAAAITVRGDRCVPGCRPGAELRGCASWCLPPPTGAARTMSKAYTYSCFLACGL